MATLDTILGRQPVEEGIYASSKSTVNAPSNGSSNGSSDGTTTTVPKSSSTTTETQSSGTNDATVASNPETRLQGKEKPPMSYVEMFKMLNPEMPETDEQRKKREKREKGEAILAAVGDSISALSNLWFTSKYAPNAYDPSKGMSATTKGRWDKLRQEREANRRAYYDGYIRAAAMDDAKDRDERNWRHTLEREKISDERYDKEEQRKSEMAELERLYKNQQITAAQYKTEQERIAAQYAEGTEQLKQENIRAGIQQKKAAAGASHANANASNARADYYRNGGSGGKGKSGPTLQLEDDEPMRFGDDKDYDRAVMRLAPDYDVPTETIVVTERNYKGEPKKQKTVQRPVKDIAADIERKAAERKKAKQQDNIMPGVGVGQASPTKMPGVK